MVSFLERFGGWETVLDVTLVAAVLDIGVAKFGGLVQASKPVLELLAPQVSDLTNVGSPNVVQ